MYWAVAFPVLVVFLKLILKLIVGKRPNKIDFVRVSILFPIDIIFLALSFWCGIKFKAALSVYTEEHIREMFTIFMIFFVGSIVVTWACHYSDDAFVEDNNNLSVKSFFVSYSLSFAALLYTLVQWS